ncbi:MAG: RHS repeat-associated core domain-containing protein [Clostridium sp.]
MFQKKLFGKFTNFDNPYRYSGYIYDKEVDYYYLQSRMYDPSEGRFIQEDSYRGNIGDPLSLNLYTYCHNNPVNFDDPNGHWLHILGGALIGAAIRTGMNFVGDYLDDGKINRGWKSYAKEATFGAIEGGLTAATGGSNLLVRGAVNFGIDYVDNYRSTGKWSVKSTLKNMVTSSVGGKVLRKTKSTVKKAVPRKS